MELFNNKFSKILLLDNKILELAWSDKTKSMIDDDFKVINSKFADLSIEHNSSTLLVDVREFRHNFSEGLNKWRYSEIIPKYHNAGVQKFAFLHPEQFKIPPNNGLSVEGENFVTMHFNNSDETIKWLES